jgi:hypothetical protein
MEWNASNWRKRWTIPIQQPKEEGNTTPRQTKPSSSTTSTRSKVRTHHRSSWYRLRYGSIWFETSHSMVFSVTAVGRAKAILRASWDILFSSLKSRRFDLNDIGTTFCGASSSWMIHYDDKNQGFTRLSIIYKTIDWLNIYISVDQVIIRLR